MAFITEDYELFTCGLNDKGQLCIKRNCSEDIFRYEPCKVRNDVIFVNCQGDNTVFITKFNGG